MRWILCCAALWLAQASFAADAVRPAANTNEQPAIVARWKELLPKIQARQPEGSIAVAQELEKAAHMLAAEFPTAPDPWSLMFEAVQVYAQGKDYKRATALSDELAKSTNAPAELRTRGERTATRYSFLGKPLELKFTSTDGREIDFETLRGKVVLIDFWASWCGPCRRAFPEIKQTYEDLHGKGFEVVGINLDEKEDDMRKVLKDFDMKYPVRFDGQGVDGTIARRFGILGIPSMWLVDKKGVVRDIREGVPRDPTVGLKLKEQVTLLIEEKN